MRVVPQVYEEGENGLSPVYVVTVTKSKGNTYSYCVMPVQIAHGTLNYMQNPILDNCHDYATGLCIYYAAHFLVITDVLLLLKKLTVKKNNTQ